MSFLQHWKYKYASTVLGYIVLVCSIYVDMLQKKKKGFSTILGLQIPSEDYNRVQGMKYRSTEVQKYRVRKDADRWGIFRIS